MSARPSLTAPPIISAAPQRVHVTVAVDRVQIDVALPLDVPVADLTGPLTALVRARESATRPAGAEAETDVTASHVHTFGRGAEPLLATGTLRDAEVTDGEVLQMTRRRALSPPALYDDVVDATARLNRTGATGWNPAAARWMALAGVSLATAAWVYLLLAPALTAHRAGLLGLTAVAVPALAGTAATAHRRYGRSDAGAALSWAVLPIVAAGAWAALAPYGAYALAAGCVTVTAVAAALDRAVGTGRWGHLGAGVFFTACAVMLLCDAVGVRTEMTAAGTAVAAALSCLAVPTLTGPWTRPAHRSGNAADDDDVVFANPFAAPDPAPLPAVEVVAPTGAQHFWDDLRAAAQTRSAVYAGLAATAATGAWTVLTARHSPGWPEFLFGAACAAALALHGRRPETPEERAALWIPAGILAIALCAAGQWAAPPAALASVLVAASATIMFATIGVVLRRPGRLDWTRTPLTYLGYLATASLLPLALWTVGAYRIAGLV